MKLFNICFQKKIQILYSFSHMYMHHAWYFTNIFRFSHIFFEHNLMKKCCAYVQIKKYFSKIAFLSKNCNFSKNMNSIKQSSSIKVLFSKFRYLIFSFLKIDFFDVIRYNIFQISFDEVYTFTYKKNDKIS